MRKNKQYIGKRRGVGHDGFGALTRRWAVPRVLRRYYAFKTLLRYHITRLKIDVNSTFGSVVVTNIPNSLYGQRIADMVQDADVLSTYNRHIASPFHDRKELVRIYNSGGYGPLAIENGKLVFREPQMVPVMKNEYAFTVKEFIEQNITFRKIAKAELMRNK